MTDKKKIQIINLNTLIKSSNKKIEREEDLENKKETIKSIDKINSKIKLNYFGKQVSFSKKVLEIENEDEINENDIINNNNLTPERNKNTSTRYKKAKEHIKTPFRFQSKKTITTTAFSRKSNLARKALLNEDDSFEDFNLDKSFFTMENDELSFFSIDDYYNKINFSF
jgi:hypothetical protein